MEALLHQLGVNHFAIYQFFIFIGLISFLSIYVFSPYLKALEAREERTKGGRELATEYQAKTVEMHSTYQDRARDVNNKIQAIFQKSRAEAMVEYERIVGVARGESQALIEKNRQTLNQSVATATQELKNQSTTMAVAITNKLLGK